jgi:hypothetical protein
MNTRFALSELMPVILRLWGVDTTVPQAQLSYARSRRRSVSLKYKPTSQGTLHRNRLLKI